MTMNKNQECQENFLKIQQGCKKNQACLKKLNIGITKIRDKYNKNQGCREKKIKQRYNKNQG